jgi:molybdopterin-guanine dinucleotide biosynthesis protein MobB
MIISVRGKHNSGKTTFIEKLLKRFEKYKIVVIKVSGKETIDINNKDTNRFRNAGSLASMILAEKETAIFLDKMHTEEAIEFARIFKADLVVIEGYDYTTKKNEKTIYVEQNNNFETLCNEIMRELGK